MRDVELMAASEALQPTYRVFRLGSGGGITSAEVLSAATDDEARLIAAGLINRFGIDLWERTRFLASFPPLAECV